MKKKPRLGLSAKLCVAMTLVLLINLALVWAFGGIFLEDYYARHKRSQLISGFDALYASYSTYDPDAAYNSLRQAEEKNIRVTIYTLLCAESLRNEGLMGEEYYKLYGGVIGETQYLFLSEIRREMAGLSGSIRKQSDSAYIRALVSALGDSPSALVSDEGGDGAFGPSRGFGAAQTQTQTRLTLFGRLDKYTYALMQIPIESVSESARLATRFSLLAGLIALAAGFVAAIALSVLFTRPIKQMRAVAGNLARLDFSRRVAATSRDELGELGRSINAMSDALQDYTQELYGANEQLRRDIEERARAEQAQKALVSNISHELKTPISIISGYAEGLKYGIAADEKTRDEYCDAILEESRSMTHLLQSLLRLARLQSGRVAPDYADVDLGALAERMLASLSLQLRQKGIDAKAELREDRMARADRDGCEQVLRNYLTNALRHCPEGGRIRVSVEVAGGGRLRLGVYNSGSRIDESKAENIWQSFYRADEGRSRDAGEVGLGLAIVKAHMLIHGMPFGFRNTEDGVEFYAEFAKAT
ncbi:MAG: HAMP domain-containing histidine kinase [Oscillospiraceae bacterium]|jgi:signal transduction histidine kinase|nr:HAMP domain-containing histidine kinase [Oscillospiraceae bacterium]